MAGDDRSGIRRFARLNPAQKLGLIAVGALCLSCIVLSFIFVLLPLVGPFSSISVPGNCTDQQSHLPTTRDYAVQGVGTGTLLVENSDTAVVVVSNYGQSPFFTHVYVLTRHDDQIANSFDFPTNVVDAGYDGNALYLFNDKLGHFLSATSAQPISELITSDNYRGLYDPTHVQTDLMISGITANHTFMFRHHLPMSNIVHGCYLA